MSPLWSTRELMILGFSLFPVLAILFLGGFILTMVWLAFKTSTKELESMINLSPEEENTLTLLAYRAFNKLCYICGEGATQYITDFYMVCDKHGGSHAKKRED